MINFIVFLMGGSPCDVGAGIRRLNPGKALTEYILNLKIWKKTKVVDIAASKDVVDEDDLERLFQAIINSGIDQVMIPVGVYSLVPVTEFLFRRHLEVTASDSGNKGLGDKKIVLWSTPKLFSKNRKLAPIAIGIAIGAFHFIKPGTICGVFKDDLFDPFRTVYSERDQGFIKRDNPGETTP